MFTSSTSGSAPPSPSGSSSSDEGSAAGRALEPAPKPHLGEKATSNMLASLNNMRLDDRLCDCLLVARGGVRFPAHQCVLAAQSLYLAAMMVDRDALDLEAAASASARATNTVELPGADAHALEAVLAYLYGEPLEVDGANCAEVMDVVKALELEGAEEALWRCV